MCLYWQISICDAPFSTHTPVNVANIYNMSTWENVEVGSELGKRVVERLEEIFANSEDELCPDCDLAA
ncbi:MAG: hypothetical protein AAB599_01930 [Patescibacteria group bacterium]